MKWTSETPTKEGWYWYRDKGSGNVRVLRLRQMMAVAERWWFADSHGRLLVYPYTTNAEWAGPIPEPEE